MAIYEKIILKGMKRNPNGIALKCGEQILSYIELVEKIQLLKNELINLGVKKNSKVAIVNDHPFFFTISLFAVFSLDAIPIPIYAPIAELKLKELLNAYDINYILKLNNEIQYNSIYCKKSAIDTVNGVALSLYDQIDSELNDVELIMFTSGTTSIPKAIMLTEENLYSNICAISDYLKLDINDRILHIKDLSHSSSVIGELMVGLYNGCSICFTRELLLPKNIIRIIKDEKITVFFAVPTILNNIMNYKKIDSKDFDSLRIINFYGASMPDENIQRLCEVFKNANIIYSYGQTEASPRVTYIERKDLINKRKSSGRPINGVNVTIENKNGEKALPDEIGEIVVEGPNVMKGYYRNFEKTRQTIIEGKLHTKDMGYMDKDGFLYVTGRKDNMLISAGKNVYPEEIEGVLVSHKDILEALVTGKVKSNGTLTLVAYVVASEGSILDIDNIYDYCKKYLELYKIPNEIYVEKNLPKTPSGKIMRNKFI